MSLNLENINSANQITLNPNQNIESSISKEEIYNCQNKNNLISSKLSMNELNTKNTENNPNYLLEKLNSNSINDYVNSLISEIKKLNEENEELKINFVQVSELREKEILNNNHKINILKSNIEILEQDKQRHINQNIIEKENLENQIQILVKENNILNKRIKELIEQNELLKKQNFDLNIINFGKNKKINKNNQGDKDKKLNINDYTVNNIKELKSNKKMKSKNDLNHNLKKKNNKINDKKANEQSNEFNNNYKYQNKNNSKIMNDNIIPKLNEINLNNNNFENKILNKSEKRN